MRIRGSKLDKTRWLKAEELAKKGYSVCAGARILGIHHATAILHCPQDGVQVVFAEDKSETCAGDDGKSGENDEACL